MKLTDLFLADLETEARLSRLVLERVPEGRPDWKPHEKSMPMGYLSALVARMHAWVAMTITTDALDLKPADGSTSAYTPRPLSTTKELLQLLNESVAEAREALAKTNDAHLVTNWKLLVGGHVVVDQARHLVMRNGLSHLAHHRGQLTVYLRLSGASVPAVYGPSADEGRF